MTGVQTCALPIYTLVELAWQQEGTIGSRMTGAGFGGCTVSIVKKDKVKEFIEEVGKKYKEKKYRGRLWITHFPVENQWFMRASRAPERE